MNVLIIICIACIVLLSIVIKIRNTKQAKIIEKQTKDFEKELKSAYKKNKEEIEKKRKPKDYNDKQVLTKYNVGTYRNEKGQYASLNK